MRLRAAATAAVWLLAAQAAHAAPARPTSGAGGAMVPTGLRCEWSADPVGLDTPHPRLSWVSVPSGAAANRPVPRALRQTAYRILVASSPTTLAQGRGDLWDTGRVASERSVQVGYAGRPLRSYERVWWSVRVWDQAGRASAWSMPGRWSTASMRPADWRGKWLAYTPAPSEPIPAEFGRSAWPQAAPSPILRREFNVRGPVRWAVLSVCGLGYCEPRLNGRKVGDHVLDPTFTRYDRRCLYVTHDVTAQLRPGRNALGFMLGNGFFNQAARDAWDFTKAPWRDRPQVTAQLRIEYADGRVEWVATDRAWHATTGPVVRDGIRNGEMYDARLEQPGWDAAGFAETGWGKAEVVPGPNGALRGQHGAPIRVTANIRPAGVSEPEPGVYVVDMGQAFAGWAQLRVSGPTGTRVTLRYAEKLDGKGMLDQGNIATLVYQGPFQTDTYILRGSGVEVWEPRFTYHGFRYVEVRGYPGRPAPGSVTGRVVHTAFVPAGAFECSNPLLNAIQRLTLWSYRGNFVGIPTDCPHREKNGWTGDAQLACEQAMLNWDNAGAYERWIDDLGDEQRPDGSLPGIVPTSGWGYRWGNGPPWDSAYVLIPWYLYRYTGDTRVLADHYDGMRRYVDYMTTRAKDGIVDFGLGDWVPYRTQTSTAVTGTGYYCADAAVVAKVARLLGRDADATKYAALAEQIGGTFRRQFARPDGGIANDSQTALSCAVYQGLVGADAAQPVADRLAADLVAKGDHIDTGILGAKYLFRTLSAYGHHDEAYRVATCDTLPSYGYWVRRGATTLWEDWAGGASLDHVMFGDISAWFYETLAGVRLDDEAPGFQRFVVRPMPVGDLKWARASHDSPYGRITVAWSLDAGRFTLDVHVPANCAARVYVPASDAAAVREGGRSASGVPGVRFVGLRDGAAVYAVASGAYRFTAPAPGSPGAR